jgi:hypothetical protein
MKWVYPAKYLMSALEETPNFEGLGFKMYNDLR